MKIGIDIDNTITNTLPIIKEYCNMYNDTVVKRGLTMHEDGVASYNLFDWTKEENHDFCINYLEKAVLSAKVKENAAEVIRRLKNEGHEIYIISARVEPVFKTPYESTEQYLKDNDIVYDKLIVGSIDKLPYCQKYNLDIFLEDEPRYINDISPLIPVIVFDEIFNKQCVGNNIYKVTNWNQVYDIINNLQNK